MKILLSIKPEFSAAIFNGSKRFEFRKAVPRLLGDMTVVIYETRPTAKITGEFDFTEVLSGTPHSIWKKCSKFSGVTKEFFFQYFDGRDQAFAFAISDVRMYEQPLTPEELFEQFTAPQSFMYVSWPPYGPRQPTQNSLL